MKKIFLSSFAIICLLSFSTVFAFDIPKATGYVTDTANVLDISTLEASLKTLAETSPYEMAILTVPSLEDETVETLAIDVFEEWGIGEAKQDTGLLLLYCC